MRSFFLLHIFPFFFASVIIVLLLISGIFHDFLFPFDSQKKEMDYSRTQSGVYPDYGAEFQREIDICNGLYEGKSIIVFGSSELNSPSEALPHKFIPKFFNYPTLSIGRAGNQSFSITTQLAAMSDYINKSKIIIIVSPGWFEGKPARGTSLQLFLDFNNERFLNNIWNNNKLPERFKNHIFNYVSRNMTDISSPNTILRLMHYKYQSNRNLVKRAVYNPLLAINECLNDLKTDVYDIIADQGYVSDFQHLPSKSLFKTSNTKNCFSDSITINWDSLYNSSITLSNANVTTNSWGIYDDYYNNHISRNKGRIKPVDLICNQEYKDFQILLDLLNHFNSDATFIIQPLNPYYYNKIDEIDLLMEQIKEEINNNGFDCLNLLTSDTTKYEKALLKDVMHMGEFGWYKVNHFIKKKYLCDEE